MPIKYSVRPATLDDFEMLVQMCSDLFQYEYDYGFCDSLNLDWPQSEAGRQVFRSYLEADNASVWIAFNEQKVCVGYLAAIITEKATRTLNPNAEIVNTYIHEDYRCSGVGRTLVEYFKEWCAKNGVQRLSVSTFIDNKHARTFYEKWGFAEAEITYEMKFSN